jgi:hypothetical protein
MIRRHRLAVSCTRDILILSAAHVSPARKSRQNFGDRAKSSLGGRVESGVWNRQVCQGRRNGERRRSVDEVHGVYICHAIVEASAILARRDKAGRRSESRGKSVLRRVSPDTCGRYSRYAFMERRALLLIVCVCVCVCVNKFDRLSAGFRFHAFHELFAVPNGRCPWM